MRFHLKAEDNNSYFLVKSLALSLFVLVPVSYSSWTQNPTQIKNLLVGLITAFIGFLAILRRRDLEILKVYHPWVDRSLLVFLFINVFSLFLNPTEFSGGTYLFELVSLIIIFYVFAFISRREALKDSFLRINSIAALLVMIIGIIQVIGGIRKPISTFGNPNYFGGYLVAMWPLLWLLLKDKGVYKIIAIINVILFAITAVWIRSWALYLSLMVSIFMFIALCIGTRKGRLVGLISYSVLMIGLFQIPFVQESLIRQIAEDIRPYIWTGVVNLIKHHPIIGCGAGQFFIFYSRYRDPDYFSHPLSVDSTDHAHCEFLELSSELGMLGLISFLLFLFFLIRFVVRNAKQRDRSFQIYVFSILTGVLLLMFENLFDVNLRYMSSKFIFWSFLGWCYGLSSQSISDQNKVQRSFTPFQKSLGVLLIVFILSSGFLIPFLSDYYFSKGVKERIHGQYEEAISSYRKSIKWWPKHVEARYRLGYLYGSLGFNQKAIEAYLGVIRLAPFFASVYGNLGAVYSQMDDLEKAYRHLSIQVKLNPYDPDRLCTLATVLIRMGKIEESKKLLRRALLFKPDHDFARTVLRKLRDSQKENIK